MLPDSKETKRGSASQKSYPSAGKNTGIVFVPYHTWKCIPTAISGGVCISTKSGHNYQKGVNQITLNHKTL